MVNSIQIQGTTLQDFESKISAMMKTLLSEFSTQTKTPNNPDELLTREEIAKMLSISLVTLYHWTNKNILQAYRIGKKIRYKKSEVLEALQKRNNFSS